MARPCESLPIAPTHAQIVRHYIETQLPGHLRELDWFAEPQTFANTVRRAAAAEDRRGKRLSHQCRLFRTTITEAQVELAAIWPLLRRAQTFAELIGLIRTALNGVASAGTLYVYDTALRIGSARGIFPDHIYLHAGSREGARRIIPGRLPPCLPLAAFPQAFQRLAPHEIENLLCRYAECL